MDQGVYARSRCPSVTTDWDAGSKLPPRHSMACRKASGGDADRHTLYTSDSSSRFDYGGHVPRSDGGDVDMSMGLADITEMSYVNLTTPSGSGDCGGKRNGVSVRRIEPDLERGCMAGADDLLVQQSGVSLLS